MDKKLLLVIILAVALAAPIGYFALLIDWVRDYSTGAYSRNPLEAVFETGALVMYTYFGIRFFNRHINFLR